MIAALLVAAQLVAAKPAVACTTPNPGPGWFCTAEGGWLPPDRAPKTPAPAPAPDPVVVPTPDNTFWLGFRYTRGTSDVRIIGNGQFNGVAVVFAYCNEVGDGCYYKGDVRMFLANASATDWTNLGPY